MIGLNRSDDTEFAKPFKVPRDEVLGVFDPPAPISLAVLFHDLLEEVQNDMIGFIPDGMNGHL